MIATGNTCSASESIINALRGINVDATHRQWHLRQSSYGFAPKGQLWRFVFPD